MKCPSKTCALIVSYNPDSEIIRNISSLVGQVEKIIVVDNGSTESTIIENLHLLSSANTIHTLFNNKNLGIAAALNQGIAIARQEGYEWIATFDQDTSIPTEYISSLFSCYDGIESNDDIAIVCPCYIDYFSKCEHQLHKEQYKYVKWAMTSGNIMKVDTLKSIGIFDEQLFIDWVDIDYCMKTRLANYKILRSNGTILIHSPGNVKQHFILGFVIMTSDHSSLRRYYLYRNRIIVLKRYIIFDPLFFLKDILVAIKEFVKVAIFEKSRANKIIMICRGVTDGVFGRTGVFTGKMRSSESTIK